MSIDAGDENAAALSKIEEKMEVSDKYGIFHCKIQCLPDIFFPPFIIE